MTENTPSLPPDIASLSFEEALKMLEDIVRQLESGQVRLEEAVTAYERGTLLKRHCEQRLAEARAKVEKISVGPNGVIGTDPAGLP